MGAPSLGYRIILNLLRPFTLTYAFLFFFFWKPDQNCIKPPEPELDGVKRNAITKAYDVNTMKKIGKHFNGTINDVVMALMSMSLREYMRKHDDLSSKSINCLMPFSLRPLPKSIESHRMTNDFSSLCFTLKLFGSFEEAIKQIHA